MHELEINSIAVRLASIERFSGRRPPIVFLHGFGSTKEDYADISLETAFQSQGYIAFDAPGFGQSSCSDWSQVSIPFLVKTARAALDKLGIRQFHLVGHSMGGLTGLMLAHEEPERVLSFIDIEGNVAPEDCFLSRQIATCPATDPSGFFRGFIERARQSGAYSSALYASNLAQKVNVDVVRGIFESMVELSDHGDLMTKFLGLRCPRMFMHGDQNASLSYLGLLELNGVEVASIPRCGHFPMYSNPVAMWDRLAAFYARIGQA